MSLRYAHVTAALAVAVTVASGATAAVRVPDGGVGKRALKAGSVTKPKLHANSVERLRVRKGSLKLRDLARTTLAQGPQGPIGVPGPTGAPGPPSVAMVRYVTLTRTVDAGTSVSLTQSCATGAAYGGGVSISGVEQADAAVAFSSPSKLRSWRALVRAVGTSPRDATLTVICVSKT
jgi:hypothetical protein